MRPLDYECFFPGRLQSGKDLDKKSRSSAYPFCPTRRLFLLCDFRAAHLQHSAAVLLTKSLKLARRLEKLTYVLKRDRAVGTCLQ
jgi:hypothetical protein